MTIRVLVDSSAVRLEREARHRRAMLQADEELAEISQRRMRREWEAKQRQLKEERERDQREVAALPAAQPVTAGVAAALPVEYRPAVLAAGAVTTTPARLPLPPRQLTFSAASIKTPLSAEAIAYNAITDALPDLTLCSQHLCVSPSPRQSRVMAVWRPRPAAARPLSTTQQQCP